MAGREQRKRELIDQSKFLKKRAKDRIAESRERIDRAHRWLRLPVGRVCSACQLSQATGEFEDALPCRGKPSAG